MQIHIKTTELELTPSLKTYAETKLGLLGRLISRLERQGEAELVVELGRTTRHHQHGLVFRAEANLRLPGRLLRAEHVHTDLHAAIDRTRDKLKTEIMKYKALHAVRSIWRWGK